MGGPRVDVGLPFRPVLFTLDQIATMTAIQIETLKYSYVYFFGRHTGPVPPKKMMARNIAPEGQHPDWRVSEDEVKRWLKACHFRVYDRNSRIR